MGLFLLYGLFKCLKWLSSHPVGLYILGEFVQNFAVVVVGDMFHSVLIDGAQPKIVAPAVGLEDIHCYIGFAHLWYEGSVGSIPHIYCSVLARLVASHGFGSFEGMYMILEYCHDFEFIEVGYPVEEGIEVSGGISVEGLAGWVDGNVIIGKFDFVPVGLKGTDHELFLVPEYHQTYP